MLFQQNSNNNEILSYDQDKYQLALDDVIKQMNLLSNDPLNKDLHLAYEQARQRFVQISNMEKDEYDKFINTKFSSIPSQNLINSSSHEHIQYMKQSKIYICYFILIFLFLAFIITCIIISIK